MTDRKSVGQFSTSKKKLEKPLDKLLKMCYNKDVNEGDTLWQI
jgi:hypothetical protein